MAEQGPSVHHVVCCVERDQQDAAAELWTELGFVFTDIDLVDVGLRVLLDWDRGMELISPTDASAVEGAEITAHLAEHGPGVYCIVVRTSEVDASVSAAERHGAYVEMRQRRGGPGEGYWLEEARLSPTFGTRITLLATDLP